MRDATVKPNCYDCKHRREIPGDAHSRCHHPAVEKVFEHPLAGALAILKGRPVIHVTALNVRGHPHGIRSGWFNWPFNYDPLWLENCDGFEGRSHD